VLTWGESVHGATGHGDCERRNVPTLVSGLDHCQAVQLVMGHEFSGLLTTDDRLYVWGNGSDGQLGNGYYVEALNPVLAKSPGDDVHWVSIACGERHMMGVTGDGAPRYDPNENTFARDRHAKESALPSHFKEDAVRSQLQEVMGGLSQLSALGGGGSGGSGGSGGGGSGGGAAPPPQAVAPRSQAPPSQAPPSQAPPPQAPPPQAPPPSSNLPTHWCYQDATGAVQGPFETSMMKAWYENDMIFTNLQVRDASASETTPFVELGKLYPDKTTSFQ